jgi:hypothetical protein
MSWLLVDDADGRVVLEVATWDDGVQALEQVSREAPELTDTLCLVEFGFRDGAILGTTSSVALRSLT